MKKLFFTLSFFLSLVATGTNYTWNNSVDDIVINNTIFGTTLHAGDTVFIPARAGGYNSQTYDRLNSGASYTQLANGNGYIVVYWQPGSYITPTVLDNYSSFLDNCYGLKIYGLTMQHCANMPWRLGNSLYGPGLGQPHGYSSWICLDSAKFIATASIENIVTGPLAPFAGDTNNMYHHWWIKDCVFDSCYGGALGAAQRAFSSGKVTSDGYWRDLEISGCIFDHYQPSLIAPSTYINLLNTWGAKIHNNIFRNMGMVAHPLGHASLINMDIGGQIYIYNNFFGPDNFANDFRLKGASIQIPGYNNRSRFYNNIVIDKRKYPVVENQYVSPADLAILSPYVIARPGPEVYNNTVYNLSTGADNTPYIAALYDSYTSDTVTVKNNLFTQVRDSSWVTSNPRIVAASFQIPSFWDTASNRLVQLWANAGITDSINYIPVNGALLFNTGSAVPSWLATDYYGNARTFGGTPDIGAVERQSGGSGNASPTANAGANQTITLPVNVATLSGSGYDPDGTIVSYAWTQVSGTAATIGSPSTASTDISDLITAGSRVFRLTVTDNQGATGTSDVTVSVNPATIPNQIPIANAGANQTIQLPLSNVTLSGSGTDADGTIVSYAWTQVNGTAATIASSSTASTNITGLTTAGVRVFRLTVTDNQGATGTSDVTVTVNPAAPPPNQAPVANAGFNQTIQLPLSNVTLSGSGTDADGTIVSYAWTQVNGTTATIANPSTASTNITGLTTAGVRVFRLTVTDNQGATGTSDVTVTVNPAAPPPNQSPVASAGPNQTIQLPMSTVNLSGSGTDADGTIVSYGWTQISGTAATITSASSASTTITGLTTAGVRIFRLTVTDNQGATGTSDVTVTVLPANIPPTAFAGANQAIQLPASSITVSGSGVDPDGSIVSYQWSKIAGPTQYTIVSPTQAQTVINNLVEGVYQFELTVTDNQGATGRDTLAVTVSLAPPPVNQVPVAHAGLDQNITLPVNTVTLQGSGTDADGTVVSYLWSKINGPAQYTIVFPAQPGTVINNLVQGTYQFVLTITDNQGAIGRDTVIISVNAPVNQPPVAHAGQDQSITLPVDSVRLTGSGTDADGTIVTYQWIKISGPAQYTIVSPAQAQTVITNLIHGTYQFELTVTDNQGATAKDTVSITVGEALLQATTTKVYPNPATTMINIEIDAITNTNKTNLWIYGSGGDLLYQEEFVRNQQIIVKQVDISKLKPGLYFIRIGMDPNNSRTLKFVKQ